MNRMSALIIAATMASLVGFAPASLFAQASSAEKPVAAEKAVLGNGADKTVLKCAPSMPVLFSGHCLGRRGSR
jgi:hypothetical protein